MHQKVLLLIFPFAFLAGCGTPKADTANGTKTDAPAVAQSQKPTTNSSPAVAGKAPTNPKPTSPHSGNSRQILPTNSSSHTPPSSPTGPIENADRKTSDGKTIPIGEKEIVAVVRKLDADKVLECLATNHIEATTVKDGSNIDIMVLQKDLIEAHNLLMADAAKKHYDLNANSSSAITPSH